MPERIVIVGSGASGVHFALSLLRKNYEVVMLDVGFPKNPPLNPRDTFNGLKQNLPDPARYFLGEEYQGVLLPGNKAEYYGLRPNKDYVFEAPAGFDYKSRGFSPLFSFARGGLGEAWTGGCYPFNDAELAEFPFAYSDLAPWYGEVARRIGIVGVEDDLTRFFPLHENLLPPLRLDRNSAVLLESYQRHRDYLNHRLGCYVGRTRVAALTLDQAGRTACSYCGRCLWGCPSGSLYTPSLTLAECQQFPAFKYVPGVRVTHFNFSDGNRITGVVAEPVNGGAPIEIPTRKLVLAAGALCTSKIFLDSTLKHSGTAVQLCGLMDNRQILVPFLNLNLLGAQYSAETYQYHQVGIGICSDDPQHYIHGLVTTFKTAMLHPVMDKLPVDLNTAVYLVKNLHCGLGIVNVNLHDTRRPHSYLAVEPTGTNGHTRLVIHYRPAAAQVEQIKTAMKLMKKVLWRLGCIVPPGMVHVRPMGASAHYSGTLPMSSEKRSCTVSKNCESHDFENLYIVDGATFPFLPAKNLTFTLMANAVRVAETAF